MQQAANEGGRKVAAIELDRWRKKKYGKRISERATRNKTDCETRQRRKRKEGGMVMAAAVRADADGAENGRGLCGEPA